MEEVSEVAASPRFAEQGEALDDQEDAEQDPHQAVQVPVAFLVEA
jgi:hypothetical protein